MATSSEKERFAITTPVSRVSDVSTPLLRKARTSPLSDETIWSRLHEAGFDEESIKRRDKAALIAYIAKLETEVFEYQHHLGLLLMEKKDWSSKYEQVKASAESTEMKSKRDQAALLSASAEAKKREESLRKSLAIEKQCLENIEKTLHEMRAESAETKITAETKMAEARNMLENAQGKLVEAESKTRAAESLQAEASRYHRIAERKLHEVEEREDDLRRRSASFNSECDEKEKQISLQRQSLCETQKIVQKEQERLLDGQALLNQREDYINGKLQQMSRLDKASEDSKAKIENELKVLDEKKTDFNLKLAALSTREEAVIKKEAMLDKKEAELLCIQGKLTSKEHDEIQRVVAKHEATLEMNKLKLEEEMEQKRISMQDEMEAKRRDCELREIDLSQREELIKEREQELEVKNVALLEELNQVTERVKLAQEKEEILTAAEEPRELEKIYLQKEKEMIKSMKVDLQNTIDLQEIKKKEVEEAQERLEATKHERDELQVLEMRLKDEIDSIRSQKYDLVTEVEDLKAEKSKFETEWELIDEKRDKLRNEADRIFQERKSVSKFLKDECDRLKVEKDELREQFKRDVESLSREREDFASKMEREQSEWFSKIQLERESLAHDIELQKIELENRIRRRRDEIDSYLKEKEESFEQEKTNERKFISSQKEMLAKEQENFESEKRRLDNERIDINLDRQRREKELDELKNSVQELQIQREKLKEQRELLRADREEINVQIKYLSQLESLKLAPESSFQSEIEEANNKFTVQNLPGERCFGLQTISKDGEVEVLSSKDTPSACLSPSLVPKKAQDSFSSPSSAPFTWLKEFTGMIFRKSPVKSSISHKERSLASDYEGSKLLEDKYSEHDKKVLLTQLDYIQEKSNMIEQETTKEEETTHNIFGRVQPVMSISEEPKVIHEVVLGGENLKKTFNLESDDETAVTENALYADQGILSGRKRGNSSPDNFDASLKQRRDKKIKRLGGDSSESPLEVASNCVVSVSAEDNGCTSLDQSPRSPRVSGDCDVENQNSVEDANECRGTEVNCEPLKFGCVSLASDQDDLECGVIDGNACSQRVENGVAIDKSTEGKGSV